MPILDIPLTNGVWCTVHMMHLPCDREEATKCGGKYQAD